MYLDVVESSDLKKKQPWCIHGGKEFEEKGSTWVLPQSKGGGRDWSEQTAELGLIIQWYIKI